MPSKFLVYLGMTVGSIVGGYIPTFFGFGIFSYISVLASGIGAILGVWIGYKLSDF